MTTASLLVRLLWICPEFRKRLDQNPDIGNRALYLFETTVEVSLSQPERVIDVAQQIFRKGIEFSQKSDLMPFMWVQF